MKKRWLPLLALFLLLAGCTGSCGSEDVTGTARPGQSELPEVSASPVLSPAPVESEDATPVTPTAEPSAEPSAARGAHASAIHTRCGFSAYGYQVSIVQSLFKV